MKKISLIITSLLFSAGLLASTTGTLVLNGIVPQIVSITVTPEPIAANLPLDVTQNQTKVATVNEISNSNTGYSVSISSGNQGALVHESVSSSQIVYSLRYDGNSVDLSSGQTFTYSASASVDVNRDVDISYTGVDHSLLIQGSYTDTVTFTIAAN